jgi:hypothetical protein
MIKHETNVKRLTFLGIFILFKTEIKDYMIKKESKPSICVDFDGVIHGYTKGYLDGTLYDQAIEGSHEFLIRLRNRYKVIICSARMNPNDNPNLDFEIEEFSHEHFLYAQEKKEMLKNWFKLNGFEQNIHYDLITPFKPSAKFYIDDRAVTFKKWSELEYLLD